jgi:hypothetical protein
MQIEEIQAIEVAPTMDGMSIERVVARFNKIEEIKQRAMVPNIDYGIIPGTNSKPTLMKPGAEKLCVLFELGTREPIIKEIREGDHYTVNASVTLFHIPTGRDIGTGMGSCSTREKKYAYRDAQRKCPACGKEAIIKGKQEFGGGFLCFAKKGGCGVKFSEKDPAITSQSVGQVENPDLPDAWNTVLKIAIKRGLVDGVLRATGSSAYFTQDIEDFDDHPAMHKQPAKQDESVKKEEPKKVESAKPAAEKKDSDKDPRRFESYKNTAKELGIKEDIAMQEMYKFLGKDNPMHITGEDLFRAIKHLVDTHAKEAKI